MQSSSAIKKISNEISLLQINPLEGIKIILNEEDFTDIQAYIKGPIDTPFNQGVFLVKISLGAGFPSIAPTGRFLTKIFHPNVAPSTGEICVSTLKKDWKPQTTLGQLLLTVKCLLIAPNPESALNEEAGKLLLEDYDSYFKHAKLMTSIHATKHQSEFSLITENESADPKPSSGILTPSSSKTNSISPMKRSASSAAVSTNSTAKVANSRKNLKRL